MLWRKGGLKLCVYSIENQKEIDINRFWVHSVKKRPLEPFCVIGNKPCTKILAIADDMNETVALYYEKLNGQSTYPLPKSKQGLDDWLSLEVTFDGNFIFAGGRKGLEARIILVRFDSSLKQISYLDLDKYSMKSISCMRRIDGCDIVIAGGYEKVVIIQKIEMSSQMEVLRCIRAVKEDDISCVGFSNRRIYALSFQKRILSYSKLEKNIDIEALNELENEWVDLTSNYS